MTRVGEQLDNPVSERRAIRPTIAYVGDILGAIAAFLASPPIAARSPPWPIVIGMLRSLPASGR